MNPVPMIVRVIATASLALLPGGLVLAVAASIPRLRRRAVTRRLRTALLLWGGFVALLLLELPFGHHVIPWSALGQALVGLVAMVLVWVRKREFFAAAVVVLAVLLTAECAQLWVSSASLRPNIADAVRLHGLRLSGPVDAIEGHGATESAFLVFHRPPHSAGRAVLRFDARALDGPYGWDMLRSDAIESLHPDASGTTVTVTAKRNGDPYVLRRYPLTKAATHLVGVVSLRGVAPAGTASCGVVYLGEAGGANGAQRRVCVDGTWRTVSLAWRPPSSPAPVAAVFVVSGFRGATYELKGMRVRRQRAAADGAPAQIAGFPAGPWLRVTAAGGTSQLSAPFSATPTWTHHTLQLDLPATAPSVRVGLYLDTRRSMLVRGVTIVDGQGHPWRAERSTRSSLWYGTPNIPGHAGAVLAIAGAVTAATPAAGLAVVALGIAVVLLTGSRAALAVLLAALGFLIWRWAPGRGGRRRTYRVAATVLLAVVVAAGAYVIVAQSTARMETGTDVPRTSVWRSAVQAVGAYPGSGLRGNTANFQHWYAAHHPRSRAPVDHAHDFWLTLGSEWGIPGVLAGVWLAVGLGILARRRRSAGLMLLVAVVLALNLVDTTLFTLGVFFPMVAALNAGARRENADGDDACAP